MTRFPALLGFALLLPAVGQAQTAQARVPPLIGYVSTRWNAPDHNRCVPDLSKALASLNTPGDLLGFRRGSGRRMDRLFAHWQGIQRLPVDGARWLVLSRSGADVGFTLVRLDSRPAGGTRFGSNRLGGPRDPRDTPPPENDRIIRELPAPVGHDHGGGTQVIGHVLGVPFEHGNNSIVVFYDLSQPERPRLLMAMERPDLPPPARPGRASAVGIAKLADGRYLLVVGERSSKILTFYVSEGTTLDHELAFRWIGTRTGTVAGGFQNMNLVTQCDGALFLVGTQNSGFPPPSLGSDLVRWYRLANTDDDQVGITPIGSRQLRCRRCNFGAGAGVYVDPDGRLLLYAVEHNDAGPDHSIEFEEFRPVSHDPATGPADAWAEFFDDRRWDQQALRLDGVELAPTLLPWIPQITSARWSIPPGWRLRLFDRPACTGRSLDLMGTGEIDDLAVLGFDDRLACARWLQATESAATPDPTPGT